LGKQKVGSDILNGKRTLMFIHAMSHAGPTAKNKIMQIMGNLKATQDDVINVIDIFRDCGSIGYAQDKLEEFRAGAKACLDVVDESESKKVLIELADYSVTRGY
jgi:geranylgeranyl diphosphate synthase type I